MTERIFHITSQAEWQTAQSMGRYIAPSLESQSFIHCSFARQVERVANHFYTGQTNLVILVIEPSLLTFPLKIETAVDVADAYPHIYGSINLDAVVKVVSFSPETDGSFRLPMDLS